MWADSQSLRLVAGCFRIYLMFSIVVKYCLELITVRFIRRERNGMVQQRRATHRSLMVVGMIALMLATTVSWGSGVGAQGFGAITGVVFQDYNGNGQRDLNEFIDNNGGGQVRAAVDRGLPDVTVTAYDSNGNQVGTAISAANGSYSLTPTAPAPYRVEFTYPDLYQPGPLGRNNASTVRVVARTPVAEIDLGLIIPGEYCQDNPTLVTSCFKTGVLEDIDPNEETLVSFPYSAGSQSSPDLDDYRLPTNRLLRVPVNRIGSVWGLDYAPARREVYAATFFKKHISFGPGEDGDQDNDDDAGSIYVLDQTSGVTRRVFTVPNATANAHDVTNYATDNFDASWDAVGKSALGGIALSEDRTTLYVMNLENRTIYALDALTGLVEGFQTVPGVTAVTGSEPSEDLPLLPGGGRCSEEDVRPFAVEHYRGQIYVGITCTAESTQNSSQLRAYVYRFDQANLSFSATPVFELDLNYPRGSALIIPGFDFNAAWRPWIDGYPGGGGSIIYPQPWLTDLSFDNGNLILNLRDRTGDTTGFQAPTNPNDPARLYDGIAAGDLLRACGSPATGWTLELNGRCNGVGRGPQDTDQGPGRGEFYFDDSYGISNQDQLHDEVSLGGSVQVPGYPDVVVGSFDAFPFYSTGSAVGIFNGGFRWHDNTDGNFVKSHVIYDSSGTPMIDPLTMGKANGLGDLIVLCDEAPIEIGNLVWFDPDRDGIQGPNERPLAGVTVELWEGTTLIATAVTDANGNYLFSAYAGASNGAFRRGLALRPNTDYQVRIPNAIGANQQTPLEGMLPTELENDPSANGTIRDSNGALSGSMVSTNLRTGRAGQNNHTYDFGFIIPEPTAITLDTFTARRLGETVEIRWRTSFELDVWGFNLYRSTTSRWSDAVRINARPLASQGRGSGGASYVAVDTVGAGSGPYFYWLEEVPLEGSVVRYGPVTTEQLATTQQIRVLLPLIVR